MQFLGNLGVDIWLLVAQIVNFLLLLWLLNKFVYKPLIKRIEADEVALASITKEQEVLEKREKKLNQNEKRNKTRAINRAKEIILEAEEIAKTIKKTAQAEAETEKKALVAQINQRLAEVSHVES